ncbi:MAG TPA: sodium:proton antiporter [Planctomycetaceae bacterium]|nr:sodium:proton antiporter [Planctomycetaceae bacterium]
MFASVLLLLIGGWFAAPAGAAENDGHPALGEKLPWISVAPFAAVLLAIAAMPLAAPHWWERNRNKAIVMAALAGPMALYLVAAWGGEGAHQLLDKLREYVSFIVLLGALFVICGGIYIQGSFSGTPLVNTGFIAAGTLLASFIGTTGASMVLIRPLLRANESRQRVVHVVIFFIFAVSNCGGLLTPLGDPPLFLGFLNGVPFEWTFRLWPQWLFVNGCLLVVFHVWDQVMLNREELERPGSQLEELLHHPPVYIRGLRNLWFLGGVIATIYCSGEGLGNGGERWPFGVAEGVMLALAAASYVITPQVAHAGNRFAFGPIIEVAVLFAGIFVTMTPALLILNVHGPELGLRQPWQYFWTTGVLSSFLDNAPTDLTFAATAAGDAGIPLNPGYLGEFLAQPAAKSPDAILAAISCGAVFMGANTYIGNGPNFMVKAIAEQHNIRMPGFFAYMLYSSCLLLPLFALATVLFFR